MIRTRRPRSLLVALYVNAGLLLLIVLALFSRGAGSSWIASAYGAPPAPAPIAGGANLYLMPAQFTLNTWGCYVMDIDAQTLCAYRYLPTNDGANLRLVAARKISYDRRLSNFNSDKPSWQEVKQWVEQANQPIRGSDDTVKAPETQQAKDAPDPNNR